MKIDGLPPLTWLRAFEAAGRHLSFTRAAAELNLTQSAVSQHVRSLETHLGRELFIRRTRRLELTEAGANYLLPIREAFGVIARGTQAFTGGDTGVTLLLTCNLAFSVHWLAPRLSRLYARHPWLVLNVVAPIWDPRRDGEGAAIEIRFGRPEDMSDAAERLAHERFFPVCAPAYQDGAVDLDRAVLLDCAGISGTWNSWFSTQGMHFARGGEVTLASTFVITLQTARHGAGITMAHDSIVAGLIEDGALCRPFAHAPPLAEGYFILPPPAHGATPASRAFRDWVTDEMNARR